VRAKEFGSREGGKGVVRAMTGLPAVNFKWRLNTSIKRFALLSAFLKEVGFTG